MELLAIGFGTMLAVAGWWYLFRRPTEGVWTRTWVVAVVLSAYSVGAIAVLGRLGDLVGPIDGATIATGLSIGAAWLVATHIGHRILCQVVPGFLDQVTELYSLRAGDRASTIVGPVVAMGLAEELLFRGVVQGSLGLVVAVLLYGLVQVVAGKWALVLAAVLGGSVWGFLYWWTGGLVAPVLAHVLWTGALTLLWPLSGCGDEVGAAAEAPLAEKSSPSVAAPAFTERMMFVDGERIQFHPDPPFGDQRAGAEGTYDLSDAPGGGTELAIDITLMVDLPLPRLSKRAVERIMAASMAQTGDRFARNLYRTLGLDPATVADPR